MADIRHMNKDFLTEFIELYRSLPCLWKVKSKEYSDRTKKDKAYEAMVAKLQEIDANANRETVKKKIDSMRGCFRKEMKKMKQSTKSGAGSEDICKPRLWYYNLLLFLYDQEKPREAVSNLDETGSNSDGDSVQHSDLVDKQLRPSSSSSTIRSTPRSGGSVQSKKRLKPNADDILKKVDRQLDEARRHDDEFDIIGKNIANKLRQLPKETAMVTEKLMLDILYEAQFGGVDKHSRINLYKISPHQNLQPTPELPSQPPTTTDSPSTSARSFYSNFIYDYDHHY
ncbi:unnamed protein product [Brassicogethes aeneus]|uniref:MADF domain-containing protein n=1 Tax=Brassicogethes aeneus TaxID=1431903 RepID=A0A9P0FPS8_BRAAE|nr:unnamed protein product [Brassicogethes aeneus]